MLLPIVMQLEEYAAYPDRYDILGVYGINGSPSCGVDYTYDGDWGLLIHPLAIPPRYTC